jgi:DNA-binding FadR family transcriptional regulator
MSLRPIHASTQLEQVLLLRILSGEFTSTLPSRRQLSREYGVGKHTVGVAMARLEARGICAAVQGVGTNIVPLIHSMDHKLLLQLIKHAADPQIASKMLAQLIELITELLSEAAARAALNRQEVHLEVLQQLISDTTTSGPDEAGRRRVSSVDEYNVWKVVAGAADNIGTTAALNALEGLWLDQDAPMSRTSADLAHLQGLTEALASRDADRSRQAARLLLQQRQPTERRASGAPGADASGAAG